MLRIRENRIVLVEIITAIIQHCVWPVLCMSCILAQSVVTACLLYKKRSKFLIPYGRICRTQVKVKEYRMELEDS